MRIHFSNARCNESSMDSSRRLYGSSKFLSEFVILNIQFGEMTISMCLVQIDIKTISFLVKFKVR